MRHAPNVGLRGKGAFVTSQPVGRWDLWDECGLEWCALQHAWTWGDAEGPLSANESTRTAAELIDESFRVRAHGASPWWWAWVVPARVPAWLDRFAADIALAGEAAPEGVILDLELAEPQGSHGEGRRAWDATAASTACEDAAKRLVEGVRERWPGEVWITTHGLQSRRQPWSVFAQLDGVLPQAYNPSCSYDAGFVRRCVDSYAEGAGAFAGRRAAVVPLLGANSTPAACMRRFVAEAAECKPPAVGWWAWTGLAASAAKRAEVAACRSL